MLQSDKLMHLLHTGINLVVNQQVIIGFHTRRLLSSTAEPGIDDLNGLCSPAYQTAAKLPGTGRRHENQQRIRKTLLHLKGALNLNLQNHVLSLCHLLLHIIPGRAVVMVHVLSVLHQTPFLNHLLKIFPVDEEIILPVLFSFPGLPCGGGYGQCVIVIPL